MENIRLSVKLKKRANPLIRVMSKLLTNEWEPEPETPQVRSVLGSRRALTQGIKIMIDVLEKPKEEDP